MKCTSCGARIPLSHRPGVFLFVAGLFAAGAVVAWVALPWPITAAAALVSLWCVGNMWAEKSEAASESNEAGEDNGTVPCPACGAENRVRAWSI